jgi:hypothetical protein
VTEYVSNDASALYGTSSLFKEEHQQIFWHTQVDRLIRETGYGNDSAALLRHAMERRDVAGQMALLVLSVYGDRSQGMDRTALRRMECKDLENAITRGILHRAPSEVVNLLLECRKHLIDTSHGDRADNPEWLTRHLFYAVSYQVDDNFSVIDTLVAQGAYVDANRGGVSLLHLAYDRGHPILLRHLLALQPDSRLTGQNVESLISRASSKHEMPEMYLMLQQSLNRIRKTCLPT